MMGPYNLDIKHRIARCFAQRFGRSSRVGINSRATKPSYPVSTMAFIIADKQFLIFPQFHVVLGHQRCVMPKITVIFSYRSNDISFLNLHMINIISNLKLGELGVGIITPSRVVAIVGMIDL